MIGKEVGNGITEEKGELEEERLCRAVWSVHESGILALFLVTHHEHPSRSMGRDLRFHVFMYHSGCSHSVLTGVWAVVRLFLPPLPQRLPLWAFILCVGVWDF